MDERMDAARVTGRRSVTKKVRKHPKGDHGGELKDPPVPTLHPTEVFFVFVVFLGGVGEGGSKRLMCFSTKSHDLQTQGRITGLVTDQVTPGRQFRKGDGGG